MYVYMYVYMLEILLGRGKYKSTSKTGNHLSFAFPCPEQPSPRSLSGVPVVLAPVLQRRRGRLQLHDDVVEGVDEQGERDRDGRSADQHLSYHNNNNNNNNTC